MKNKFKVKAKVWIWSGGGASSWHFVSIPPEISEEISKEFHGLKRGWGSLPVLATIPFIGLNNKNRKIKCKSIFETSIFPNKKDKLYMTYLLPLKKTIRREVGIQDGDIVEFVIEIKKR